MEIRDREVMMKEKSIKLMMSVVFVFLIFACQGIFLYYGEGLSFSETLNTIRILVGNVVLAGIFTFVVVVIFSLIYNRIFRKKL